MWVDPQTQKPVQPIGVEGAADLDGLLDELKIHLDAMVADRQRHTEQLNAKLAEMNAFERSRELQKRTFKSAPQYLPLRNAVVTLRAVPDTVKTMGRLLATGGNILEAVSDAVRAGSMAPIQSEIEKAVAPMVETAEQGKQATAMIQVLLNDEETCDLLYDFAERYVKAMHPLDIAEYGLKAASVIVTLIASAAAMIYTGGTGGAGTAGKLLINIKRLRKVSPVVDKIYKALKCMAHRTKLPKLIEKGASKVKRRRTKTKGKGGVPEVKTPDKIDKNRKKGYSGDDDGQKKTSKHSIKGSITEPTGEKGGKPTGKKTEIKGSAELKRSLKSENESAELLADKGYKVQQNPEALSNGRKPDYKIEGKYFDCYSPKTDNLSKVRNKIAKKVKDEQADRIIINLDDCKFDPKDIAEILNRKPKKGLKEVIGIKNSELTQIFP